MRLHGLPRTKTAVILLALIGLLMAGVLALTPRHKSAYPTDLGAVSVETTKLADNVFVLRGAGGNVTVIDTQEQVIIVDTDFAEMAGRIDAAVHAATGRSVTTVVNTHSHADHRGGNGHFAREGAQVISQEVTRANIETDGWAEASADDLPTRVFTDRLTLAPGVEAIYIADGHTKGDVVVRLAEPNIIATGDLFVHNGFPFISQGGGGSIDGYIAAQTVILDMIDENTIVVPGHGGVARKSDIEASQDMLYVVRNRIAELKREGLTEEEMLQADPMRDFRDRWNRAGIRANHFAKIVYHTLPEDLSPLQRPKSYAKLSQ
ncbi:MAG: MBL fold metallo-hydrolase [Parvularculaceae bacterium]